MNPRLRLLLGNVAALAVGKGAGLLLSLLAVPLVVAQVGPRGFGMWAVCQGLISWLQVLDLGLGLGLQNRMSHAVDADGRLAAARAAGALRATMRAAVVALVLAAWAAWAAAGERLLAVFGGAVLDGGERRLGTGLLAITVLAVAVALLAQVPVRIATGLQQLRAAALGQVLGSALGVAAIALGPRFGLDPLWGMAALALAPPLIQGLAAHAALGTADHAWSLPRRDWTWPAWRDLVAGGAWLFASQVAALVVFQTDVLVVSALLGPLAAGSFQATARLFAQVVMVQGILLAALWPALATAWAQGDLPWIRAIHRRAAGLTLGILVPLCLAGALLAGPVVRLWTGDARLAPGPWLAAGLALGCATALWAGLHAYCLNATGATRGPAILALVQAALNLPATVVAAHLWGGAGVAWASALCALCTSVPVLTWQYRRRMTERQR